MLELPYDLERTVLIRALPETVFRFFTDSARFAAWWGAGSTIDACPEARCTSAIPTEWKPWARCWRCKAPSASSSPTATPAGIPFRPAVRASPSGWSQTSPEPVSTCATNSPNPVPRDLHVQGWRFQLSLFANAVANEVYAGAEATVDQWFEAWTIAGDKARAELLARIASPEVSFRDRYSLLEGLDDLVAHTGAAQRFMPGIRLQRNGSVRQCQGAVLAEWTAVDKDGKERMSGTSIFQFRADGRIDTVTSFAK